MRISPVAWAFNTLEETLAEAVRSAVCTHDNPDSREAALVIAGATYLARKGQSKEDIREFVQNESDYDYQSDARSLRAEYGSVAHCRASVPLALRAFYDGSDYEDVVRKAVHFGGDTDTNAAMAGAMAEAFYGGVPVFIVEETLARLDEPMRDVVMRFRSRYELGQAQNQVSDHVRYSALSRISPLRSSS